MELAIELPEPGVVSHPIGAEMDQPGLAHAAVVVGGRAARPTCPLGIPVHPLVDVGDIEVIGSEEAGDPGSLLMGEVQ